MMALMTIPITAQTMNQDKEPMKRVTGIGGVFFKCKDPQAMKQWYEKHLGIPQDPYGYTFKWYEQRDSDLVGRTVWSPFPEGTDYFGDPGQQVMINYRVDDIERLVEQLRQEGVTIVDDIQDYRASASSSIFLTARATASNSGNPSKNMTSSTSSIFAGYHFGEMP